MANQISVNSGSGAGAQQIIVDTNGNITVTVSRSVIGTVANVASANYANYAGNVVNSAQPNITSVGNLTSLNITGTTTTGNLVVTGNLSVGNLVANNANYANFAGVAYSVAGANVSGTVANAAYAANAGNATNANTANVANVAYSVSGANVTGTVANATYAANAGNANIANTATIANTANIANTAYSVSVGNVSGIGNIATVNLDGNSSNVLKGDGTFGPEGSTGNANYANFAGTAYSVSGSNVSGAVANATYADNSGNSNIANTAYAVSGANVTGAVANATFANDAANANIANTAYSVAVGNVSGIGNIATINIDGNASNVLHGDGTFGPEGTTGNANYAAYAGNVTVNAQPNITSLGTLTALTANANGAINLTAQGGPVTLYTSDNANLNNIGPSLSYFNPTTGNVTALTAGAGGQQVYIANGAPGNSFPGNVKAIWFFDTNGNLSHSFGGTGNINVKGLTTAGNVAAGRVVATGNVQGNVLVANYLYGNGSNISNINGANVSTVANANYAANAGYADNAGNANIANIANIAYSVDVSNVANIGNIATINLDGNVSNALLGDGTFGAVESANANLATYANIVIDNAQPNITSVGTLTALVANTTTAIDLFANNANVIANVVETANLNYRSALNHRAIWSNNQSTMYSYAQGVGVYIANIAAGNTGFGNLKGVWQFNSSNGNLDHIFGGTGNVNPKGLTTTGNVAAGRVTATGNVQGNNVIGSYLYGDGSNISNISGANVTGTVANATYALDAGNANIANTAYSVDVANVSGIGNIATINLDGNVANALLGDGTFGPVELSTANTVTDNAQPNITSVGNLVSLTVDANIANTTTVQIDGNLISFAGENAYSVVKAYDTGSGIDGQGTQVFSAQNLVGDAIFRTRYYADNAKGVEINTTLGPPANISDPLTGSGIDFYTYGANSNTANANTLTFNQFSLTDGFAVRVGYPIATPALDFTVFGDGGANTSGIRFRRRNGNNDARTGVVAGDYLGNIDWQGSSTSTGGFNANATIARIAPKVESTYGGAGTGPIPTGVDLVVSNGTTSTHNFHSNGNVTFSKSITANLVTGTLTTAAQPNVTSVGTLTGLNVSGNGNINIATTGTAVVTSAAVYNWLQVNNAANTSGATVQQQYTNYNNNQGTYVGASDTGVNMSLANLALPFPSSLQGVWRFEPTGNLSHIIGGTGNVNAKGFTAIGNITATANINATGNMQSNNMLAGNVYVASNNIILTNTGNITAVQNITAGNGNVTLNTDGTISYLRTFGSFTSNATQTSNGANTTNYMTFNNTEDANGVSIVSSSQLTVARTGRYNIQFSAQVSHDTNATANIEIWLTKNGSAVANTNSRLTLVKDQPTVAAWNFVDNVSSANTYYQLAWASPDINMELLAYDTANTLAGVAIPSVIATITPVGA